MNPGIVSAESSPCATIHWCPSWFFGFTCATCSHCWIHVFCWQHNTGAVLVVVYANRALHCRSRYAFNANSGCQTATHVKTCSCVVRPQHTWRSSGDNICYASRRRMTRPAQCSSRRDNNNSCESRRCIIRSGHIVYVAPQHMVIIAPLYHHCSTKLRSGTPTFVKNRAIVS